MTRLADGRMQEIGEEMCDLADRASRAEYGLRIVIEEMGAHKLDADELLALARTGNDFDKFRDYIKSLIFFRG